MSDYLDAKNSDKCFSYVYFVLREIGWGTEITGGAAKQIGKNSICCIKPVFAVFWSIRFNNLLNKNKK